MADRIIKELYDGWNELIRGKTLGVTGSKRYSICNLVMPSTPVHSSVEDVTVTSQPKSEQKKPDAHLINGNP